MYTPQDMIQMAFVEEFMTAMGQEITLEQQTLLIIEEAEEVAEAGRNLVLDPTTHTMEAYLKEVADFMYVRAGYGVLIASDAPTGEVTVDVLMGLQSMDNAMQNIKIAVAKFLPEDVLFDAFLRVHESNMSKLGADGKPVFNEDNKVLKGPNYEPPVLDDLADEILPAFLEFREPLSEADIESLQRDAA